MYGEKYHIEAINKGGIEKMLGRYLDQVHDEEGGRFRIVGVEATEYDVQQQGQGHRPPWG